MRRNSFVLQQDEIDLIEKERIRAKRLKRYKYDKRLRGLLLTGRDGKTQEEAAGIIEMNFRHFQRIIRAYRQGGIEAIEPKSPPGRPPRLFEEDMQYISQLIEKGPEANGYDSGVWDGKMVKDLIKKELNISFKKSQINRLLHKMNFTKQYPKQNLYGSDPVKKEDWKNNILEPLKKKRGVILYEDEAVFQQSGTMIKTWAKRGIGAIVDSMPCRNSMKYFGAISLEKNPRWIFRSAETFNAETFKSFLKQILKRVPKGKIFLILDNARYHHAVKVREFLIEQKNRLRLIFLPPYSPDLNLIEKVWKTTKKLATHNRFFRKLDDLKNSIVRRFNRYQGNPAALRGLVLNQL